MPESQGAPHPRRSDRSAAGGSAAPAPRSQPVGNPQWFVPVMTGLMILGVLWVATFYITAGDWPAPIGYWNLVVGMGAIMAGFVMATRWR